MSDVEKIGRLVLECDQGDALDPEPWEFLLSYMKRRGYRGWFYAHAEGKLNSLLKIKVKDREEGVLRIFHEQMGEEGFSVYQFRGTFHLYGGRPPNRSPGEQFFCGLYMDFSHRVHAFTMQTQQKLCIHCFVQFSKYALMKKTLEPWGFSFIDTEIRDV